MDAYLNLPSWLGWRQLLDYAHLVVCRRETDQTSAAGLLAFERSHQVETTGMLKASAHGKLFLWTMLRLRSRQQRFEST